jgi:ferrous iron transport protein B
VVALVGQPNVGKSLIFNRLTGARATVSNYPGTTVEVARSRIDLAPPQTALHVVDTPGMYSLSPLTEEERVARRILLDEHPCLVIHVVDAKNLPRMLPMTLELLEAGLPLVLVVNMMDEARRLGQRIDLTTLEQRLQTPVYPTVGTTGEGLAALRAAVIAHAYPDRRL